MSPDGRWLAYTSNESGRAEVSVRAFPGPAARDGAKFPVSTGGGDTPVWSRTGSELFYQSGRRIMAVSYRVEGENFVAGVPRVWADLNGATFWDMGPGGRALITVPEAAPNAEPKPDHTVVFLQNFFDELRRRVPVNGK